jgi:RNA polymerase sigma factor (sigma-70 family)
VSAPAGAEHLWRELTPQVLGTLVRRYGRFDACEDAVQEALLAASVQWSRDGIPENPRAWLIAVASRRLVDELRSDGARRRREVETIATATPPAAGRRRDGTARVTLLPTPGNNVTGAGPVEDRSGHDDSLAVLFMCCHEALTPASQIALTLRAVGGLTTAEIASAFLVPEATMAQRISRAKQSIRDDGAAFELPRPGELAERLAVVLHVLYLIFNEGYTASSGPTLQRLELAAEAIRLARMLSRLMPDDGEVLGLLALMLLTHARRAARTLPDGTLAPLAEQDRSRWDRAEIDEGVTLVTRALAAPSLGPYRLQAAIAAVHAEAATAEQTDWPQIVGLYALLERVAPNPMITLNRAVAVAMVKGPRAGLELLGTIEDDERIARGHRLEAVRAHLLELAGEHVVAAAAYRRAARLTTSLPEQRYLESRAVGARERATLAR